VSRSGPRNEETAVAGGVAVGSAAGTTTFDGGAAERAPALTGTRDVAASRLSAPAMQVVGGD
jgi:hypothetical protein